MFQRLTILEKRIATWIVIIAAIFVLPLLMNIQEGILMWFYEITTFVLIIALEAYVLFLIISGRSKERFVYISLQINGVSNEDRTRIDVDGRLVQRLKGKYNGTLRLRSGVHKIRFYNESFSVSADVDTSEDPMVFVEVEHSTVSINIKHKDKKYTADEIAEGLRSDYLFNMFLFLVFNLLLLGRVLRLFLILDII